MSLTSCISLWEGLETIPQLALLCLYLPGRLCQLSLNSLYSVFISSIDVLNYPSNHLTSFLFFPKVLWTIPQFILLHLYLPRRFYELYFNFLHSLYLPGSFWELSVNSLHSIQSLEVLWTKYPFTSLRRYLPLRFCVLPFNQVHSVYISLGGFVNYPSIFFTLCISLEDFVNYPSIHFTPYISLSKFCELSVHSLYSVDVFSWGFVYYPSIHLTAYISSRALCTIIPRIIKSNESSTIFLKVIRN